MNPSPSVHLPPPLIPPQGVTGARPGPDGSGGRGGTGIGNDRHLRTTELVLLSLRRGIDYGSEGARR